MLSKHLCPLVIALLILTSPSIAYSDVSCEPLKPLDISGKIRKGDFQRFRSCLERIANQIESGVGYYKIRDGLLMHSNPNTPFWMRESPLVYPATVFLNTSGGDVLEAMNIGSLIGKSFIDVVVKEDKTCRSACFFIIVGAYDLRIEAGAIISVHRPYFDKGYFSGLSLSDADAKYKQMQEGVKIYLRKMDVPTSIVDSMFSIASDEELPLTGYALAQILKRPPAIEEWLKAKCGSLPLKEQLECEMRLYLKQFLSVVGKSSD